MKINNIKINSYGKLNNKEINLSENINIIHGENESGKSTLLSFIINIFYGISKTKKGKDFSDYDRYKPWDGEEFSGKIAYSLDNNEKYEVFRDFNKKSPKIYNDRQEEITKEFSANKITGSDFFVEQTKVDEATFLSTLVSMQQNVKLEQDEQNSLIQKIANMTSTGDDNVSYQKALDRLNKKQLEEIGTERSQGRPINLIRQEKNNLLFEKNSLLNFKERKYEIEEIKNKLNDEIVEDEIKLELFKSINLINEKNKLENEKINLNNKILIQNREEKNNLISEKNKLEELINNKINNNSENNSKIINENNNKNTNKINYKKIIKNKKIDMDHSDYDLNEEEIQEIKEIENKIKKYAKKININKIATFLIVLLFILIGIINIMFTKIDYLSQIVFACIPLVLGCYLFVFFKQKNKIVCDINYIKNIIRETENKKSKEQENIQNEVNVIQKQIEIIDNKIVEQENEIQKLINNNNQEIILEKEKIKNNYLNNLKNKIKNEDRINCLINEINNYNLFNNNLNNNLNNISENNLIKDINLLENKLNKNKLDIHSIEIDEKNINPKLEKLAYIEERLQELEEQESELIKENNIIELVKDVLQTSYNKMKDNVTPKFTNNLSNNIEKISDGKYKNVRTHDEEGLIVEKENGEYISCKKLSIGTIEQLYLSLRFALVDEISYEKMPIILDEAFAYYDTKRLSNILKYVSDNYKENQIIIFTCTNREKEILDNLNIKYNLIEM